MTLYLILAEAELELAPSRGTKGDAQVLDAYLHHYAMRGLPDGERRGRPDIVHQALSLCQESRLNRTGGVRAYVHTREDMVIEVGASARVPPNQMEFLELMGRLLNGHRVKGYAMRKMTFRSLIEHMGAPVMAMCPEGLEVSLADIFGRHEDLVAVVGAFPCGDFRGPAREVADILVSLGPELLTVPVVVSEILCAAYR